MKEKRAPGPDTYETKTHLIHCMAASGHKPSNVHDRYLNFTDKQLTDAFQIVMVSQEERWKLFPWCSQTMAVENESAASY